MSPLFKSDDDVSQVVLAFLNPEELEAITITCKYTSCHLTPRWWVKLCLAQWPSYSDLHLPATLARRHYYARLHEEKASPCGHKDGTASTRQSNNKDSSKRTTKNGSSSSSFFLSLDIFLNDKNIFSRIQPVEEEARAWGEWHSYAAASFLRSKTNGSNGSRQGRHHHQASHIQDFTFDIEEEEQDETPFEEEEPVQEEGGRSSSSGSNKLPFLPCPASYLLPRFHSPDFVNLINAKLVSLVETKQLVARMALIDQSTGDVHVLPSLPLEAFHHTTLRRSRCSREDYTSFDELMDVEGLCFRPTLMIESSDWRSLLVEERTKAGSLCLMTDKIDYERYKQAEKSEARPTAFRIRNFQVEMMAEVAPVFTGPAWMMMPPLGMMAAAVPEVDSIRRNDREAATRGSKTAAASRAGPPSYVPVNGMASVLCHWTEVQQQRQ